MRKELKIDPEFENYLPRLTEFEYHLLEDQIVKDGRIIEPIITWNGTIVDGHHRYRIAQKHEKISYNVMEMEFSCKDEAKLWIGRNQLHRRNNNEAWCRYYVGKIYELRKRTNNFVDNKYTLAKKGKTAQVCPSQNTNTTRITVAKELHVSNTYVQRAAMYTKGIDAAEEVMPGIKYKLLGEEITANINEVSRLAGLSKEARIEAIRWLQKPIKSRRDILSYQKYENARDDTLGAALDSISHFIYNMENYFATLITMDLTEKEKKVLLKELNHLKNSIDVICDKLT